MALNPGNAACTTGLSKRIYDAWTADIANNGFVSPLNALAQASIKSLCYAFAAAVVAEIQANAAVAVNVNVNTPNVSGGSDSRAGTGAGTGTIA